jgi:hypothetical protein
MMGRDRLQDLNCWAIEMGEIFDEFGESRGAFEIVKEGLEGDSGADENGGAAHDVGVSMDETLPIEGFLDVHDGLHE